MTPSGDDPAPPQRHPWKRNPVFQFLASLRLAVLLLAVLILVSIVGTLAESKFDADTARTWIYEAPWFYLWLAFLGLNLTCSALTRWPWRRHHTGFLLTHLGIIVVMVGAVVGQIFGIEGTMTLFRGRAPDNALVLAKRQLIIRDPDSREAIVFHLGRTPMNVRAGRPVHLWKSSAGWTIEAVEHSRDLLATFVPQPSAGGATAVRVRLHTAAMNQTVDQWLLAGDKEHSRMDLGLITVDLVAPGASAPTTGAANRAVVAVEEGGSLRLSFPGGQGAPVALPEGVPTSTGWNDWTIEAVETIPAATPAFTFSPVPRAAVERGQQPMDGLRIRLTRGNQQIEQWVAAGWRAGFATGPIPLEISYGWEVHRLPFGLVLEDFLVERNEGTDEPAAFRSMLRMVPTEGGDEATGSCSMNQPANYPQAWWRSLTGLTYKISQASWNPNDLSQSSVQILRDPGWFFKWTGSLILTAGLVTMFIFRPPTTERPKPVERRRKAPARSVPPAHAPL